MYVADVTRRCGGTWSSSKRVVAELAEKEALESGACAENDSLELSQEALGERCDLNMSEVSRLERSQRDPPPATVVKLAGALGIPPAKLLDGIP